jgi:hypothetical protein
MKGIAKSAGKLLKGKHRVTVVAAFLVGIFLLLRSISSISALGQVDIYFDPPNLGLPPDGTTSVMLDAQDNQINFVRFVVNFDNTRINLTGQPIKTALLSTVVIETDVADANASGSYTLVMASSPDDQPVEGVVALAQMTFSAITDEPNFVTQLVFIPGELQVVDANEAEMEITAGSADLLLNETASPTPTLTPTPTDLPPQEASLSLSNPGNVYVNQGINIDLTLSSGEPASGVDAVITYDPALLEYEGFSDAALLNGSTQLLHNLDSATILISQVEDPGESFSGVGVMGTLNFRTIAAGNALVGFDFTPGSTNDSNVIALSTGTDILSEVSTSAFDIHQRLYFSISLDTPAESDAVSGDLVQLGGDWQQSFTTDSNGVSPVWELNYTFAGITADFTVKIPGYLRKTAGVEFNQENNSIDFGLLLAGDINDDGIINNLDLSLMYEAWFGTGVADYNADGIINSFDHWILTQNFLKEDN